MNDKIAETPEGTDAQKAQDPEGSIGNHPDLLEVPDFVGVLAELYAPDKVVDRLQWLEGHGLVAVSQEKRFVYLHDLPGWPDSIEPGYRVSEFDVAATYWAAGEDRYPWKDAEGEPVWLDIFHNDDRSVGLYHFASQHFILFPEKHPVDDVAKTRKSGMVHGAVNEARVWLKMELGRNRGYFVDWKHWFRLLKWDAKQAACLLFSVAPDKWEDPKFGWKEFDKIPLDKLKISINHLAALAKQYKGEATPGEWADWVRKEAQDDLPWEDVNPRFKAFLKASETPSENLSEPIPGQAGPKTDASSRAMQRQKDSGGAASQNPKTADVRPAERQRYLLEICESLGHPRNDEVWQELKYGKN